MNQMIPIIDFQPFLEGNPLEKKTVAQQFYAALADVGCLYLKNYGFSTDLVAQVFAESKAFFDLPLEEKMQLALNPKEPSIGYYRNNSRTQEIFNYAAEKRHPISQWPENLPGFRDTVMEFFQGCEDLSWNLFQALAMSLQLLPTDLTDLISDKNCHGALLHYPPINNSPEPNKFRFKPHTGAGTFGLIFQDEAKGLEICTRQQQWIPVSSIPGTVVVIMEDLIQRWTNDQLYSTLHKVSIPEEEFYKHQSRYSLAFKVSPNDDAEIRCFEKCVSEDNPRKYSSISVKDYYQEWEAKHLHIYSNQN
ncbi:isopenicillin N synthase family dioxygenase [Aphanothece sacrum]|uniref:Oxidoreductase n=1 Tax=Aphanothece sacrum FPU1 TaxID=1920663 RepID=A0A401IGB6_APHSA|nr:2-oxoglutarate and iron-dependent oxygenase domain-containing protein [Aphanothece sacrum]GBF80256.1 oxidoreductase [Aphanothece sacrum FPU1]GBF83661.1 oxidoreductase [Aphanothece sacrum FPU3]